MANLVVGAAAEWIRKEIGGIAEGYNDQIILPQGDTVLLPADGERIWLTVANLSENPVFLHFGFLGNQFSGIRLSPRGGQYSVNIRDDFLIPAQQIRAQVNEGNSPVYLAWVRRYQVVEPVRV